MKLNELLDNHRITITQRNHSEGNWYDWHCTYRYSHKNSEYCIKFMALANIATGVVQCIYLPSDKPTLGFTPPCDTVVRKAQRLSHTVYEIKAWVKSSADLAEFARILTRDLVMLTY